MSTNLRETWECLGETEVVLVASMGKPVELGLVGLELLDKVDEMAGLLEQLKVLGVNQVPELVLNADHEFDGVEGVKTVLSEDRKSVTAALRVVRK